MGWSPVQTALPDLYREDTYTRKRKSWTALSGYVIREAKQKHSCKQSSIVFSVASSQHVGQMRHQAAACTPMENRNKQAYGWVWSFSAEGWRDPYCQVEVIWISLLCTNHEFEASVKQIQECFWNVIPCSLVEMYQRFSITHCLFLV
jgi:hypothetical protein